ncbi:MAG TPA: pyridoxamine 5'-phosphate oxidase family protein [Ktedonobacteraceae bacterium]
MKERVQLEIQAAIDQLVASGKQIGLQVAVIKHGRLLLDAVGGVCLFFSLEQAQGVLLMHEPSTKIDPRFSDPDAVTTEWEETRQVLAAAELFWLSTVRADGRPHVTPLVAVWLDGAIHFCTGATEQKAINLRDDPRVILTTGCNRWDGGLDVVVEGDAVQLTDDKMLARLAEAWASKWDGRWQFEARAGSFHHEDGGIALVFSVTPARVLAFAKGHFSQTSHQF